MSFYDGVLRSERARLGNYGMSEEYIPPKCPLCGSRDWDYVYRDKHGDIVGCEMCVDKDYDWEGD